MTRSTRRREREALAWALEAMTPANRLWTIASAYVLPPGFWWLEEEPGLLLLKRGDGSVVGRLTWDDEVVRAVPVSPRDPKALFVEAAGVLDAIGCLLAGRRAMSPCRR